MQLPNTISGGPSHAEASHENQQRVYARRAIGCHHDHRHPDRALAAGRPGGARRREPSNARTTSSSSPWALNHESHTKRMPTGGWGYQWTGDADRGTDWRQPGGWIYNVLPYIEQRAMHDMGAGMPDPALSR